MVGELDEQAVCVVFEKKKIQKKSEAYKIQQVRFIGLAFPANIKRSR